MLGLEFQARKKGGHGDKKKRKKWTMCLTQISVREMFVGGNFFDSANSKKCGTAADETDTRCK